MIVADSSIWIDHWKLANAGFTRLLMDAQMVMHPYVLGELALGSLKNRHKTIADLKDMISVRPASHDEVLQLIEARRLFSRGVGYIDLHLLAAALLNPPLKVLTRDSRLRKMAEELGVAA